MLFSFHADRLHHPGIRHGSGRRHGDRRVHSRFGPERSTADRRHFGLQSALPATVVIIPPHQFRPEPLDVRLHPPLPTVTATIDSMVGLPARHAYDTLIRETSSRFGVDSVSSARLWRASRPLTRLPCCARGLMQLIPEVAVELGVHDPLDPRQNVIGGTKYLRRLLTRYRGNLPLVLASYNAGAGVVEQYGGVPPFPETQKYVRRVTNLVESAR